MGSDLKCVAYLSRDAQSASASLLPPSLYALTRELRARYTSARLNGLMLYRHGCVLHIIEGSARKVASAVGALNGAALHAHMRTFLDEQVDTPLFRDWSVKAINSAGVERSLRQFHERHHESLQTVSGPDRDDLSLFLTDLRKAPEGQGARRFRHTTLSLRGWPDFRTIGTDARSLTVCARLYYQPTAYETLLASKVFESQKDINILLESLSKTGVLEIRPDKSTALRSAPGIAAGFYERFRAFLERAGT